MRLLKLLAFSLFGYVMYEFIRGVSESRALETGDGGEDLQRALDEDTGRMQNMTGTGRGRKVSTEGVQGLSVPHVVGRGVVH